MTTGTKINIKKRTKVSCEYKKTSIELSSFRNEKHIKNEKLSSFGALNLAMTVKDSDAFNTAKKTVQLTKPNLNIIQDEEEYD